MSEEKLRALLAEARMYLTMNGGSADDRIVRHIDAVLAEPVVDWQPHEPVERTEYVVRVERERDEARAEVERLKKAMEDRWFECHDGSESACCKSHE